MEELTRLIDRMAAVLAKILPDVKIQKAFPAAKVETALTQPVVVLEHGAVTIKGAALGDYLPGSRGKRMKAAVRFTIYTPLHSGGETCTGIFSKLCQALLFDPDYGITSVTAGSVKINRERHACELTATAVLETNLLFKTEGGNG